MNKLIVFLIVLINGITSAQSNGIDLSIFEKIMTENRTYGEGGFSSNKKAGQWIIYWKDSSFKYGEGEFLNDEKDGTWKYYRNNEHESNTSTEQWRNGKLINWELFYGASSSKKIVYNNKDGLNPKLAKYIRTLDEEKYNLVLIGISNRITIKDIYYDFLDVLVRLSLTDQATEVTIEYYYEGKIDTKISIEKNDIESLKYQYFGDELKKILTRKNDNIISRVHYKYDNGKEERTTVTYGEQGKITRMYSELANVGKVGDYQENYSSGKKRVKGFYAKGKKKGVWKYWDENGKLTHKEKY